MLASRFSRLAASAVSAASASAAAASAAVSQQRRWLNLHEYQSRMLLEECQVSVQRGSMADSPVKAAEIAKAIKKSNPKADLVVKAQIHAGGRGKGTFDTGFKGGVKVTTREEEAQSLASAMLGHTLVTHQTGPAGQRVMKVLINEGVDIKKEMYLAIVLDRKHQGPCFVACEQGGVDIEEVAARTPDAIVVEPVDVKLGPQTAQLERLASALGLKRGTALFADAMKQMQGLYSLFVKFDATQVEINPFAVASVSGSSDAPSIFAVDAKLNFDDNASFRQERLYQMRDVTMEDPRDVRASQSGLNYIGLDGNIGCMVNGAGLAMATMDIIKLKGGNPANFLDVGGGATAEQVAEALSILTSDPKVKAILVNIFGGIMKCDTIANGIIEGARRVKLQVPMVVRLEGTNVSIGKQMLQQSGLRITTADNLDDAATKAVATLA